jgi:hypothetical protein
MPEITRQKNLAQKEIPKPLFTVLSLPKVLFSLSSIIHPLPNIRKNIINIRSPPYTIYFCESTNFSDSKKVSEAFIISYSTCINGLSSVSLI